MNHFHGKQLQYKFIALICFQSWIWPEWILDIPRRQFQYVDFSPFWMYLGYIKTTRPSIYLFFYFSSAEGAAQEGNSPRKDSQTSFGPDHLLLFWWYTEVFLRQIRPTVSSWLDVPETSHLGAQEASCSDVHISKGHPRHTLKKAHFSYNGWGTNVDCQ